MLPQTIKKISLKKFQGHFNCTIDDIPKAVKLICLIGKNGSGKSSIFNAFIWNRQKLLTSRHSKETIVTYPNEKKEGDVLKSVYIRGPYRYDESGHRSLAHNIIPESYPYRYYEDRKDHKHYPRYGGYTTDIHTCDNRFFISSSRVSNLCRGDKEGDNKLLNCFNKILGDILGNFSIKIDSDTKDLRSSIRILSKKRTIFFSDLSSGERAILDLLLDFFLEAQNYKGVFLPR